MKIVAFHSNELNIRGTNVAMYDYAVYNENILGNKSYIISNANSDLSALDKFKDRFEVFLYNKFEDSYTFANQKNIEYVYYVKAGDRDGREIPGTKSLIHAVFQHRDEHGDAYAYISEWLAKQMNMPDSYIPYIVDMPNARKNYRAKLGIPSDAIIIGRHGGYTEFNLPFVYNAIYNTLSVRDDIYFLFMNTQAFGYNHKNIIHIQGTYDMQHKSDFINTCDYMIHGRDMGESFGLAISEFLYHDKPVISWKDGNDKNHIEMMSDKGIWYNNESDLTSLLSNITVNTKPVDYYKTIVEKFAPSNVMKQFNKIFLSV
jgi:hypothetical protein